jgi:uncharacterized protein (DUF2147 family)
MRIATKSIFPLVFLILFVSGTRAERADPVIEHPGVWLLEDKIALQFFECGDVLCARVIYVKESLDAQGLLKRDRYNPDPALRERQVCGPTIVWNLHPTDASHWVDGWFYNPDGGSTYRVKLDFQSADVISARIYVGTPVLGKTKTLIRVPIGISAGWC